MLLSWESWGRSVPRHSCFCGTSVNLFSLPGWPDIITGIAGRGRCPAAGDRSAWLMADSPWPPALGGLISGVLVYSLAPEAEGHGTDSAIKAFHRAGGLSCAYPRIKDAHLSH